MAHRRTNRGPFGGQPLPPSVLAELAQAAGREDAILHILDHDETVRMLHLAADAECGQLAYPVGLEYTIVAVTCFFS
jgi:hypothetical protein